MRISQRDMGGCPIPLVMTCNDGLAVGYDCATAAVGRPADASAQSRKLVRSSSKCVD